MPVMSREHVVTCLSKSTRPLGQIFPFPSWNMQIYTCICTHPNYECIFFFKYCHAAICCLYVTKPLEDSVFICSSLPLFHDRNMLSQPYFLLITWVLWVSCGSNCCCQQRTSPQQPNYFSLLPPFYLVSLH